LFIRPTVGEEEFQFLLEGLACVSVLFRLSLWAATFWF